MSSQTPRRAVLVPQHVRVPRSMYRRLVFRRLFYVQLAKIVLQKLTAGGPRDRIFVSRIGGIGDLVNVFAVIERLAARAPVELGTGPYPYDAFARNNPYLKHVHAPFVYRPTRRAHCQLIERILRPFYKDVILLDPLDREWSSEKHISQVVAERCGVPPPERGVVYLSRENRQSAVRYLAREGVRNFIYVAQLIRRHRPWRSWPLGHYRELLGMLRERFSDVILVDTTGSDEADLPEFCRPLGRLDVLTAAAVIEQARLFIGPDSGLAHVAGALGVPTVSIHLGYPPAWCRVLGANVRVIHQGQPFDDPAKIEPEDVFDAAREFL